MISVLPLERLFVVRERAPRLSRKSGKSPWNDRVLPLLSLAFDADWYRSQNPDVAGSRAELLTHYRRFGHREGRRPCRDFDPHFYANKYASEVRDQEPFEHYVTLGLAAGFAANLRAYIRVTIDQAFDHAFYLKENLDVVCTGLKPVDHYLEMGADEGRNPHPDFDTLFYLMNNQDVRSDGINPYFHYLEYGRSEGRHPNAVVAGLVGTSVACASASAALERASARRVRSLAGLFDRLSLHRDQAPARNILFDDQWYREVYQTSEDDSVVPAFAHYHSLGKARGNWPHPLFDVNHYHAECKAAGLEVGADALDHYTHVGAASGISPHRLFDCKWYASELERVGRNRDDASLTDYVMHGWAAGLDPHPLFSTRFYREQVEVSMPDLMHYVLVGWSQRRCPHPLFDVAFYLSENPAALQAFHRGLDPLIHYLTEGMMADLTPHRDFDPLWYKALACPPQWSRSPLEYLCLHGLSASARLSETAEFDTRTSRSRLAKRNYRDARCPFVSVIIVNMNGERHLEDLFQSLTSQTYSNFEVIFVDNHSTDASRETLSRVLPAAKLVALDRNAGFAEANNIGLKASSGDLIALLNNDTRVDPNWLSELVGALARHPQAGAVTSRVRFWTRFRAVTLTSTTPFDLDYTALVMSLTYAKVIVSTGNLANGKVAAARTPEGFMIDMKLPADEKGAVLDCLPSSDAALWLVLGKLRQRVPLSREGRCLARADLSALDPRDAFFVINNAGSSEPSWLATADIGFGDFDLGQHGSEREVPLACGCAMIVRRSALLTSPLFVPDFVAYFEDSELSRRLRKTGHTIVYAPGAIVYHKHSSTTTERSSFWHKQVRRNTILYKYMEMPPSERGAYLNAQMMDLNHYHKWLLSQGDHCTAEERLICGVLPDVMSEIKELCQKVDSGVMMPRAIGTRIGIYNRYWNTRGGGEAHALFIASYLTRFDFVELISDLDFDIEVLGSYFQVDISRFRKRLLATTLTEAVTAEYDIFVNSTYMDETPSAAEHSFFIVSFPSKDPSDDFKRSYTFLTNSGYTRRWTERYWGTGLARLTMLEPVVAATLISPPTPKKKVILSVGRFFRDGHSKNQLQIVRAFKEASLPGWTLKLAGSVGHQSYFDEVEAEAQGAAIELFPDASVACLRDLYAESAIYVHASGLGQLEEEKPENFEHFGMTVAEACANGCFPVVYDCAGPADIVKQIGIGMTYSEVDELSVALSLSTKNRPCQDSVVREAASTATSKGGISALSSLFDSIALARGG